MGWCVTKEGYGIKTQTITMVLGWVVCWCVVVSFFVLNLDGLEKKRDTQHVLSVVGVGVGGNEGTRELEPKQMAVDGEMMEE